MSSDEAHALALTLLAGPGSLASDAALSRSIGGAGTNISSARGYGVGLGMLDDLMVFAGGFKGNAGLDAIDVYNTSSRGWSQAKMSTGRTLFDGAALGPVTFLSHDFARFPPPVLFCSCTKQCGAAST